MGVEDGIISGPGGVAQAAATAVAPANIESLIKALLLKPVEKSGSTKSSLNLGCVNLAAPSGYGCNSGLFELIK